MVEFYVFPAPRNALFGNPDYDSVRKANAIAFADFSCAAVKYKEGMTISDVMQKVKRKWLKQFESTPVRASNEAGEESIEEAVKSCLHGYIVLEETAKMLLMLKKSYQLCRDDQEMWQVRRDRFLSYLNMLLCMRAEGTYVDVLTDGKETWLTHEDERLRKVAHLISHETHCLAVRPEEVWQEKETEETTENEMPILPAKPKRRSA